MRGHLLQVIAPQQGRGDTITFAFANPRAVRKILAARGNLKIVPGGKGLPTCWKPLFSQEDYSVLSPVFTRFKICGCRSRTPFALLANFVPTGAVRTFFIRDVHPWVNTVMVLVVVVVVVVVVEVVVVVPVEAVVAVVAVVMYQCLAVSCSSSNSRGSSSSNSSSSSSGSSSSSCCCCSSSSSSSMSRSSSSSSSCSINSIRRK